MMNIAIQGTKGSFHDIAATKFYGDEITLTECMSFTEIPELLTKNISDNAIMAIENSLSGSILSNYNLIDKNNLSINGEIYLPMIHNFMALPGQNLADIKEVWSHPIAIQNCQNFLRKFPNIRIIEEKDTASAAKSIRTDELKGVAAIASARAAELYELEILENEIQDDLLNITRYFVLSKQRHHHSEDYLNNKASLKFITRHQTGNLAEILSLFAEHNLSLSKIQSMPISKDPSNYAFFMDITFDDYHGYCQVLLLLEKKVKELKILGEYPQNKIVLARPA